MKETISESQCEKVQDPPRGVLGVLRTLGPGMIIAGSIVGSGELIATTSVGAESGFVLLWLILIGCAIKVFVQVEIGRHTITWSQTTLDALNRVPGPRLGANWLVWGWAVMTLLILTQQGGIVGGVGQALAIKFPVSQYGQVYNQKQNELIASKVMLAEKKQAKVSDEGAVELEGNIAGLQAEIAAIVTEQGGNEPRDAHYWATGIAIATSVLMYFGRYGLIQALSIFFVSLFSLITIATLFMLQRHANWAVSGEEFMSGLTFSFPPPTEGAKPIATALAAFGLIGVGAGELMMYPYWCLEKGYAQSTGKRDDSEAWASRAKGWMRIMQIDAWGSMVVYTFATAVFLLLGAAVLWRSGLNPAGGEMVRTLSQMYVPVFGDWAAALFLFGAFAVLYSTFFVVTAGFSRMIADGFGVFGLIARDDETRSLWTQRIGIAWPLLAVSLYWFFSAPKAMVLASGVAQALMLPALGFAALYFRYKRIDRALKPGMLWDVCLWISFLGLLVAGLWIITSKLGFV